MNLILNCPVDLVAQLLGDWLSLLQLSRLEVAMCSGHCRPDLMGIFERVVLKENVNNIEGEHGQHILDWLVTRNVRVSSLQIFRPLPKNAGTSLTALLSHSKYHILRLNVHSDACPFDPLIVYIRHFCPKIADLDLRNFALDRLFFEVLNGLNNLRKLRLIKCTGILPEYCNEVYCSSVDHLRLDGKYSAPVQRAMISMCPNLITCDVYHADDVDLSTLPSTAQKINVYRCARIVAWNLNTSMYNVRVFRSGLTNEQVAQVIAQCPNLQYFNLGHSPLLSEATIVSISDAYKHRLLGFRISWNDRISLTGLQYAIKACKNLRYLSISRLDPETTQDCLFVTIAQNCPALHYLTIVGNTISDDALETISHIIPLKSLNMKSTEGYTERGIMALATGCAGLRTIYIDHILVENNSPVKLLWLHMRPLLKFL